MLHDDARQRKSRKAAEKRVSALRAPLSEAPILTLQLHEDIYPDYPEDVPMSTAEAEVSLAGTSAPLLTNPSLTDVQVIVSPLPDGTSNLQDTEARNNGLSSTDKQAAPISFDTSNKFPVSGFALARANMRSQRTSSRSPSSAAQRTLYKFFTSNSS